MLYVKELFKSYEVGKNKYEVLKGIDFHVAQGSLWRLWDRPALARRRC